MIIHDDEENDIMSGSLEKEKQIMSKLMNAKNKLNPKQAQILSIQPICAHSNNNNLRKRNIGSILNPNQNKYGNPFLSNSNASSQMNLLDGNQMNHACVTNTNDNSNSSIGNNGNNGNNGHNPSLSQNIMLSSAGGPPTKRQKLTKSVNKNSNNNPLQFQLLRNPSISLNTNNNINNNINKYINHTIPNNSNNNNVNSNNQNVTNTGNSAVQSNPNLDQQCTNIKLLSGLYRQ